MRVSVIVRSYQRGEALKELVASVRRQSYPDFEVVIYEQSADPQLVADIESLGDARIRVVAGPRKDPPAARNEAIRHGTGDVLLFIDDDDLPIGDDWIARHARNYEEPYCVGVVGRLVADPVCDPPPRFPRLLRLLAMRQTFFKDPVVLAHGTLRKEGIDILIGSNASVRRSLVERIGGWDEGIPMNEEQSFMINFSRRRVRGEKVVYDPRPAIWRRTDVPGGLGRRNATDWHLRELEARLFYYEQVVGHYCPRRYRLFYPLFCLRSVEQVFVWIWDPDNGRRSFGERARASLELVTRLPQALRSNRFDAAGVRRVPRLI